MKHGRLVIFLWCVIGVLLVGFIAVTVIALNRSAAIQQARTGHKGDIESLQEQLRQAKSPHPTSAPLVESTTNAATPAPTATPKITQTPKPQ